MTWNRTKKTGDPTLHFEAKSVFLAANQPLKVVYDYFETSRLGLSDEEVEQRADTYGKNIISDHKKDNPLVSFIRTFINPFIGILMALALVSLVMDVLMAAPADRDWTTVIVITTMVLLSAIMRFVQERKSNKASEALKRMVRNTASIYRNGKKQSEEVNITELVPGDIVYLSAGDMIPADIRIVESKDLFVSQSSLTGESDGVEKTAKLKDEVNPDSVVDLENICFMGSNVVSGSAIGIVFATGQSTYFGTIARSLQGVRAETSFDKGINKVSLLLIRFMLVMVPFVFLINGFMKHDWFEAFLFAISVAVGLTPEMLPMIVTSNLAKGAVTMAKHKTIVKNLNAIQNFGAMNILCTDKTGTLTCDKIVLEKYLNVQGINDPRVLRHAFFNSFFQTGLKNLMDQAILSHAHELHFEHLEDLFIKIDEIPFDFTRRRMSVVVENKSDQKRQIITKGAMEEMLAICSHVELNEQVLEMTDELRAMAMEMNNKMNEEGMRVLAIAHKSWVEKDDLFEVDDEVDMVLIGYLAFLDPPKPSAASAIRQLHQHGVEVKVLSGDNLAVVKTVCAQVGIDTQHTMVGNEIETLSDEELSKRIVDVTIFAKLTPIQKTRIIQLLQQLGNTVGFLGDGINDASALRHSDIGISVDTAVDIAKESADIILLEKDLMVLENGVIEGRRIFGNIMKYIKMTASSNFGNMFSVLAASAFLPFLPMLPVHLLFQNLLYDISQTTIPFDRVDQEYIERPRKWDASDLKRFMMFIGPLSSIFDITTFLLLWYVFKCTGIGGDATHQISMFQSGWFIEGLMSQTLIVHMIRTRKIPFFQSKASWPVLLSTGLIMAIGVIIPFTPLGASIHLTGLPWQYFPWLIATLLAYCTLTQFVKTWYVKRFQRWL